MAIKYKSNEQSLDYTVLLKMKELLTNNENSDLRSCFENKSTCNIDISNELRKSFLELVTSLNKELTNALPYYFNTSNLGALKSILVNKEIINFTKSGMIFSGSNLSFYTE